MRTLFLTSIFFFFSFFTVFSQKELGNWVMYFGQNKVHENWSIHSEIQWRNHTIKPKLEQLLLRAGVNYHFNNQHMITAGYGYIYSQPFDLLEESTQEHRIWQQYIMKNELWRIFFEHRFRYEQRFIADDFKQRLRYRLMLSIPFNKKRIEKGAVFFSLYDEIFVNVEPNNYFDRNRFYLGIGCQIVNSTNIQLGIMNQSLSNFSKNYMQLSVTFNPKLYKD